MLDSICFLRHGKLVHYQPQSPTETVLDYLRLVETAKGTKEGCNEGDCGACTVALGEVINGTLHYKPVNSCILFTGHLHGKELVSVDELAQSGTLHPVQQALVEYHGSQCGFCTPGFVMSLFTLYHAEGKPDRQRVLDHLAGNLCRCTGYRPIIDAALKSCTGMAMDAWSLRARDTLKALETIAKKDVFIGNEAEFVALPASVESLCALAQSHPDATLVAGATDVGLWVTKQLRPLPKLIHLGQIAALRQVTETEKSLTLGASVTYAEGFAALSQLAPDMGEVLRRIGSTQVRSSGTIVGNIANGSPIGDMPPMLIALGASLTLRHETVERSLPLEEFFIAYGQQNRAKGEVVLSVCIEKLQPHQHFKAYKISKRFDQDISALMAAFNLTIEGGTVTKARIAFGGMAATPKRAKATEAALINAKLDDETTWAAALSALETDFQPLSDMRASKIYRLEVAQNLLKKALYELAGVKSSRVLTSEVA